MLLIWDITSFCNLNCIHCYNAEKYDGKRALGRELTIEESLEVVNHLEKAGFKEVLLLGGEPLLYPDLIRLIGYLKSKGFRVIITTNGTLLNEKMAQDLIQLKIDSL